jgi:flagellar biosynthetic protein FliR
VQLALGESTLAGFVLALARTAGFVLITPPFNTRSVPAQARVGLAVALALPLSALTQPGAPTLASSALIYASIGQAFMGLTLGFFVLVAVTTIQSVGDLLDTFGGFTVSMALDPMLLVQTSVMGRLHQITAAAVLFASDGHLIVLQGLTRSLQLAPQPSLAWDALGRSVTAQVAGMFLAALQICGPIIAAMLVADVALGLLTRAAPALNAFSLGYPLKILFTLLLAGLVLARLPEALGQLVEHAVVGVLDLAQPAGHPATTGPPGKS